MLSMAADLYTVAASSSLQRQEGNGRGAPAAPLADPEEATLTAGQRRNPGCDGTLALSFARSRSSRRC